MSLNTQRKNDSGVTPKNIRPEAAANKTATILSASGSKEAMQRDILEVISLINARTESCNNLKKWISEAGPEREVLDAFLRETGLPCENEARYAAFVRVGTMREENLRAYMAKIGYSEDQVNDTLEKAYAFVARYHINLHEQFLQTVEEKNLLTPFHRELLRSAHRIGLGFAEWYPAWNKEIVLWVNRRLEKRFGEVETIMNYLETEDLQDKGHDGITADRSYSMIREKGDSYEKLAYIDAFPREIHKIIQELHEAIERLTKLEDDVYGEKTAYINYFGALATAFSETETDSLVALWADVDRAWMKISGPFQVVHPLEFYEDVYRKAVATEWELRITNNALFETKAFPDSEAMFTKTAKKLGLSEDSSVYESSLASLRRVQLHLTSPALYYGSHFTGLCSAQVVPNDAVVTEESGKKIFSFAKTVLENTRAKPKTKLARLTLSPELQAKRDAQVYGPDELFYRIYDVSTIGHEYGHTLWMDRDTETRMNTTGNFKNIEEWKATTGGLVAFLQNPKEDIEEAVVVELACRAIGLIARMKVEEVVPYYTEGLIHLKILFDTGVLSLDSKRRAVFTYDKETAERFKKRLFHTYESLATHYIEKRDASEFLSQYAIREGKYFLPADPVIRDFVVHYHKLYEEYGNMLEEA